METSASYEARSAPSSYPTGPQTIENKSGHLAAASFSPCLPLPGPEFFRRLVSRAVGEGASPGL
jgi:hypothetical protein